MKPVIIKNIEIGKGLPKIAVPLVAANTQELAQALRVLKEIAFDIIEFRADFFQTALNADFIAEQLGIVRQAFPAKPLLFTFRRAQEGGNTPCSDDYYFELLEKIILSKQADIIDIELFAEEGGVKQTIALAHEYQTVALLCNHDFQATPSLADITGRLKTMAEWGADICKIAVMPQSPQDVLTLLQATYDVSQIIDRPIITMSMGKIGAVRRLAGSTFGSAVTFGAAGKTSAPGQIDANELRKILAILG